MKSVDMTSRLGQFAWRQIPPSSVFLPVIFRNETRDEYLCVQMINIHCLSKYPSEFISICSKQFPLEYLTVTKSEAKLFQSINQFHANGSLDRRNQLDYSRQDLAFITLYMPFLRFYQFLSMKFQQGEQSQMNLSNVCEMSRSYCRSIRFHDKDIMSYCTSSLNESNETLVCLSIQDVVSTYFPWTTIDEFIRLCRLKQIVRYKPDKSTNSDLSLRFIHIEQLQTYWFYFIQQLLPEDKKIKYKKKTKLIEVKTSSSNENDIEIECLLNELIVQIEQNVNAIQIENKTEETIVPINENKILKRKQQQRRRRQRSDLFVYRFKRRRRKHSMDKMQFWLKKYSIKPLSVCLQRISVPTD